MGGGCDLSIVLPAFNEARLIRSRLALLIRHLEARSGVWEIVVVDDGSTDGTGDLVAAAAGENPRVRLVRSPVNEGKGAALARGMAEARGEVLVATDADLSYALPDLDAAEAAVRAGADVVTGNRRHPESRIDLPSGLLPYLIRRWVVGSIFHGLVVALFRPRIGDTQCGLKAFSRRAAGMIFGRLRTRRFLADIEIFLAAREQGLPVVEIPVHLHYLSGGTTVRIVGGLPGTLRDMAAIKVAQWQGRYR